MNIWRINIKTDAIPGVNPHTFCIQNQILGVGWPVNQDSPLDKDAYYNLGVVRYYNQGDKGWWPAINAVLYRMQSNDLCWTRDRDGNYYIGRIDGEWEYRSEPNYIEADVVNIRPCKWFEIGGVDSVPGKVLNSFRAGRTVQAMDDKHDKTVSFYSKLKYNELSGGNAYNLPSDNELNLFDLIWPEDCEDIVGIYLQEKLGYRLIPSTCKNDTLKTEFVLKNTAGRTAYVQVKQNVSLNINDYAQNLGHLCDWYLFTTNGEYYGGEHAHVHCLNPEDMRNFTLNYRNLMSGRVQTFIAYILG